MLSRLSRPALCARVSTLSEVLDRLQDQAQRTGQPFEIATSAVAAQHALALAELRQHDDDEQQRDFMQAIREAAYGDLFPPSVPLVHPEFPEDRYDEEATP